jgi:hypothetical protein
MLGDPLPELRERLELPQGTEQLLEACFLRSAGSDHLVAELQAVLHGQQIYADATNALAIVQFMWPELANDPDRRPPIQ